MLEDKHKTKSGGFKYLEELRSISRTNRKNPTKAESLFWEIIIRNNKTGYRFLRQKPIGQFILDFYCSKLLLAIEIDGGSHISKKSLDMERDKYLLNLDIKTVRYTNKQVFNNLEDISKDLKEKMLSRKNEFSLFVN